MFVHDYIVIAIRISSSGTVTCLGNYYCHTNACRDFEIIFSSEQDIMPKFSGFVNSIVFFPLVSTFFETRYKM